MHFESAKALYQPGEKSDRWIACHAALGHRPVNGAYHRWIRQQWRAFASVLGLNARAGCRAVEATEERRIACLTPGSSSSSRSHDPTTFEMADSAPFSSGLAAPVQKSYRS